MDTQWRQQKSKLRNSLEPSRNDFGILKWLMFQENHVSLHVEESTLRKKKEKENYYF